jgi:hypothetical protein
MIKRARIGKVASLGIAIAAFALFISTPCAPADTQVRFDNLPIFDVITSAGPYTAGARARIFQASFDNAISSAVRRGIFPIPVVITTVNTHPAIEVAGVQIGVVSDRSAAAAKMTPAALAQVWADKIRAAIADQSAVMRYAAKLDARNNQFIQDSDAYTHVAPAGKSTHVDIPKKNPN